MNKRYDNHSRLMITAKEDRIKTLNLIWRSFIFRKSFNVKAANAKPVIQPQYKKPVDFIMVKAGACSESSPDIKRRKTIKGTAEITRDDTERINISRPYLVLSM